MYEKMLYGRKILYFRHAPPFTNLDDTSARDTQPPFEGAPGYQCSVYYYWWAFLRESKAYKECCDRNGEGPLADLYAYFGDVRDADFMRWWRFGGHKRGVDKRAYSGRRLFSEGVRQPIKVLRTPDLHRHRTETLKAVKVRVVAHTLSAHSLQQQQQFVELSHHLRISRRLTQHGKIHQAHRNCNSTSPFKCRYRSDHPCCLPQARNT